ncbi:MAG: Ig-like domain-containing protein [Peptococcia bacterium]
MKTKKLIAILTIVALMMTLVPMAAFAAPNESNYSAAATQVVIDKDTATVGSPITFTVVVRDSNGLPVTGQNVSFYVKSSSDAVSVTADAMTFDGKGIASPTGKKLTKNLTGVDSNLVTFKVVSSVAGPVTITLYNGDKATKRLTIDTKSLNFTADAASATGVTIAATSYNKPIDSGKKIQAGLDFVLSATVKDANGNGIAGQEVIFQKKINGGNFETIGTATTNALGIATLSAAQTKSGMYEFVAKSGDKTSPAYKINVHHGTPFSIEAAETSVYAETAKAATVRFIIKDAFGNIFGSSYSDGADTFVDN